MNGSPYNFYINGKDGETEAISLAPSCDNVVYNVLADGEKVAQVDWNCSTGSFSHYYYLKGHLGDVKMTVDAGGDVVGYGDYYPFGVTILGRPKVSSADEEYQFTGRERDAETGGDYFAAR